MRTVLTIISLVILYSIFFLVCVDKDVSPDESKNISEQNMPEKYKKEYKENINELHKNEDSYQRLIAESKDVVKIARKDLSDKLNISEDEIIIDTIVPVEWPDTSFGYPKDDKQYDMNLTKGYTILLLTKGKLYEYHTDRDYKVVPPPNYLHIEDSPSNDFEDTETSRKIIQ